MTRRKRRVAVLGGGMAGLAAAWALSGPDDRGELDVTVLEAAPELGGKGASTRGVHGRIEEHGLHVWLGYYDNAFRLVRELYEELELPLSRVLAAMEQKGVLVDTSKLATIAQRVETECQTLEAKAQEVAGRRFAIRSRDQLETLLFDELKLPVER